MKTILQHCIHLLEQGESLVLVTVVSREGSAPRRTGARMIIRENKKMIGTIGGGGLEAAVCRQAAQVFKTKQPVLAGFDLSRSSGEKMLCGGRIEVLIDYAAATDKKLYTAFHEALQAIQSKQTAWLVTVMPDGEKNPPGGVSCLGMSGNVSGGLTLSPEVKDRVTACADERNPRLMPVARKRFFIEPLSGLPKLFIFGSGHIAQQVAVLAVTAGFRTTVLDDRREYLVRQHFPLADELVFLESYAQAFTDISVDEDSYVVILTRNAALDSQVLNSALKTKAEYIGMIGSRQKCRAICDELKQDGFSRPKDARLHAPIGLDIGAETPEEVAISIVAELIRQRSGSHRNFNQDGRQKKNHVA